MGLPYIEIIKKLCGRKSLSPTLRAIKKDLKSSNQSIAEADLSREEQQIIDHIQKETAKRNLNNLTRTRSYLEYYQQFPEIHWAFLGHMVSRNGGWNMTDLKGELLSKLLSMEEQRKFFTFLERGNWLIFHDVYPQLRLYQESLSRNKNLFHLLPVLGVSKFMEVIWNHFLITKDKYLLAIALVINEQSYLQKRIIQNQYYKETVLDTIEFKLQDILSLNQILFPLREGAEIKVTGQTIHHFASLHDRIILGKRLYHLLFDEERHDTYLKWACQKPHTGSRKDYWPQLFNDTQESVPGKPYKKRTEECLLRPGTSRIYSPKLRFAWENIDHKVAETGDWFTDWKVIRYLQHNKPNVNGDIYDDYCETLERIELAILAKETF